MFPKIGNSCRVYSMVHQWNPPKFKVVHFVVPGTPGAGAGKGGGAGGSVRESGGGLGQWGTAQEEGYFYNKQKDMLKKIKEQLKNEEKKSPENEQRPDEK